VLVTGGAGFIGSHLADRLVSRATEVVVYDDFSTGVDAFLDGFRSQQGASVVEGDVLDRERLEHALDGVDTVFHLAANADVRHGLNHPGRDLEQNTQGTFSVLEAMRSAAVERIVFASTGSVYGEPSVFPTPEDAPFPVQTSLYGASKLAGEGLIGAYCHGYGFSGIVLRFVSILGERYTHGHVIDFYRALKRDGSSLRVLGDGRQEKSYLYIGDCIDGVITATNASRPGEMQVFNLGTSETLVVDQSIAIITERMGLAPQIEHVGGRRGWPGDSPLISLDTTRLRALGWAPRVTIAEAIDRTLGWFDANPTLIEEPQIA
jgi:UDP-glucose 4-epimerase